MLKLVEIKKNLIYQTFWERTPSLSTRLKYYYSGTLETFPIIKIEVSVKCISGFVKA